MRTGDPAKQCIHAPATIEPHLHADSRKQVKDVQHGCTIHDKNVLPRQCVYGVLPYIDMHPRKMI